MSNWFGSVRNTETISRASSALRGALVLAALGISVSACSDVTPATSTPYGKDEHYDQSASKSGVFGSDGIVGLFGGKASSKNSTASGIGVNSYLWRASLDTLSFLPLSSADPFGGVIITDWYAPPASPDERFKVTIYILDRELNAAALKAAVFRQTRDSSGNWVDAAVDPKTAQKLEDEILTRSRELRIASAQAAQQQQ